MYDAYWNGVFDVRWEDAPLGQEALRLVLSLRKRGYAERTCRDYGHAVIHLGRVLAEGGAGGIPDDAVVERFLRDHLPVCRCYRSQQAGRRGEAARRGLAHLLAMLREEGALPVVRPDEPPFRDLIEGYCRFLRRDRGLAETTVVNYRRYLRDFLVSCGSAVRLEDLVSLCPDDVLTFSRERGAALGRTAWNHLATSLSGFFCWLDLQGYGAAHLVGAVPLRRRYRFADVPCALSWDQVQALLSVVENGRGARRNYAMLLLIATYGLRGCEVRALRLRDIDWEHDQISIFSPKTGRRRVLPLTRPVGDAVLNYLMEERPSSSHEEVFLSKAPPHGPLRSKINPWLGRQLDKAGIVAPRRGAHVLRHSLAVHLLRSGETLKSIGDVLGHRSPDTTYIYTKLRVEDLRTVALGPEVVS